MSSTSNAVRDADALESLKKSWVSDPCWSIEDTDGFEQHREELRQFRLQWERDRQQAYHAELVVFAARIGCSDNLKLAEYVRTLEERLERVSRGVISDG